MGPPEGHYTIWYDKEDVEWVTLTPEKKEHKEDEEGRELHISPLDDTSNILRKVYDPFLERVVNTFSKNELENCGKTVHQ